MDWIPYSYSGKFHATEARHKNNHVKTKMAEAGNKMTYGYYKAFCTGIMAIAIALTPVIVTANERGSVTNLPIPRFVSMKAKQGNVRRGPGLTYRIDWVFHHNSTPLLVTAEFGHWRRVQDKDGQGGWMHYALLSGVRTAIINAPNMALRRKPNHHATPVAYAEEGAIVSLDECILHWCSVSARGKGGWAMKSDLWGVFDDELRE
jgi:SH3-like domain-containing protein